MALCNTPHQCTSCLASGIDVSLSHAISINCVELVHIFQQPSKLLLLLSDAQMQGLA